MTVIYEQTAKYQYTEEKMSDKAFSKVAGRLMDAGLILTSWHYGSRPPAVVYGEVEDEAITTTYEITIGGKTAISTQSSRHVNDYLEQLQKNGFDADMTEVNTTTIRKIWAQPKGTQIYMYEDMFEGKLSYNQVELGYELDDSDTVVTLKPYLRNSADGVVLILTTTLTRETVLKSDRIKPVMVDVTLNDFGALNIYTAFSTDCNFDVKTHSESECSPDIIAQREEATRQARNAPQEDE